tara:strand:- start:625 stop:1446 length:822 start_codon:yes stop_codon:yes gene_type:complete
MNNQLIIGSVQMPTSSNRKANLETMESYLAHINKNFPQVELVVFPELASTDFNKKPRVQAEELPGKTTKFFSELAKKYNTWLVPGSVYELESDNVYNTCPVFNPSGKLVGRYRKRYPWTPYEKTEPGREPFVFNIKNVGKVGLMVCYDIWFPEVSRDLVNLGAELLIVPTMTTTGDRAQERIIARATAITQQCYVVTCNSVGYAGVGGSQIIDPEGFVLQDGGGSAILQTAVIDFNRIRNLREVGIAGVTAPLKTFYENKQGFKVYKKNNNKN